MEGCSLSFLRVASSASEYKMQRFSPCTGGLYFGTDGPAMGASEVLARGSNNWCEVLGFRGVGGGGERAVGAVSKNSSRSGGVFGRSTGEVSRTRLAAAATAID